MSDTPQVPDPKPGGMVIHLEAQSAHDTEGNPADSSSGTAYFTKGDGHRAGIWVSRILRGRGDR